MRETPYNTLLVQRTPEAMVLSTNAPGVTQSLRRHDGGPTGQYWDVLAAVPALVPGVTAPRVLFLGVAGGTAVERMLMANPDVRAEGVEIDPGNIDVARRYFGLTVPVVAADARRFLARGSERFDAIVIDLYATGQIPAHVATREFYAEVKARLAPGGVVALNVYGGGAPGLVVDPIGATLEAVFPSVLEADAGWGNVILLAWDGAMDVATARSLLAAAPAAAQVPARALAEGLRGPNPAWRASLVLTDDRSDLEVRAARALAR